MAYAKNIENLLRPCMRLSLYLKPQCNVIPTDLCSTPMVFPYQLDPGKVIPLALTRLSTFIECLWVIDDTIGKGFVCIVGGNMTCVTNDNTLFIVL